MIRSDARKRHSENLTFRVPFFPFFLFEMTEFEETIEQNNVA